MKFILTSLIIFFIFSTGSSQINSNSSEEMNKAPTPSNTFSQPLSNGNTILLDSTSLEIKEYKNKSLKAKSEEKTSKKTSKSQELNSAYGKVRYSASHQSSQRSPTIEQQREMNEICNEMLEIAPDGFESNLNFYASGNYNVDREKNLRKAQSISPNNTEVLKFVAANAIIKEDHNEAKSALKKLNDLGVLSNESISYGKDLVISACGNTTLITHGFDDTYASSLVKLEKSEPCAQGITIISLDFLQSSTYKEKLTTKGYILPSNNSINTLFLKEFCEKNSEKNIAISMTVPKPYLQAISDKLFPSGIVFEYGNASRKSIQGLEKLWFNELNKKVIYNYQSPLSQKLSANYLPLLIYLSDYYSNQQNTQKYMEIQQETNLIKKKSGLIKKK